MLNEEHYQLILKGVSTWNEWRQSNPEIIPDLDGCLLLKADLKGANLSWAHLFGVDLSDADLSKANLSKADLKKAKITTDQLADIQIIE